MTVYEFVCPQCGQSHQDPVEQTTNMMIEAKVGFSVSEDEAGPEELEYKAVEYSEMEDGASVKYVCPVCMNKVADTEEEMKEVYKNHGNYKEV